MCFRNGKTSSLAVAFLKFLVTTKKAAKTPVCILQTSAPPDYGLADSLTGIPANCMANLAFRGVCSVK
jgi:hypothetical protein